MGKRLGEYTRDNTKCMLPVNGIRLIDRTLSLLAELGIRRVVIVVGYQAQNLIEYIGQRYDAHQVAKVLEFQLQYQSFQ